MSRRKQFRRLRDLQDNLKKYNAFSINGYFPLFDTINDAIAVSPVSSYHIHEFEGIEYYMPDGLEMGKTQFHGDYKPDNIESVVSTPIQAPTQQLSSRRKDFLAAREKLSDYLPTRLSGGCGDTCGIILTGIKLGGTTLEGFFHYDHNTNTHTHLLDSNGQFIGSRQDIARWDDKLYAKAYNPGSDLFIEEYRINSDCTVTLLRTIEVVAASATISPGNYGHGMDMKDANTIIWGSVPGNSGSVTYNNTQRLIEIDISGNCTTCPATPSIIVSYNAVQVNQPGFVVPFLGQYKAVDVIYMQDTNEYLVSMIPDQTIPWSFYFPTLPQRVLRLFSSTGQLLDECPQNFSGGLGLYRNCNRVTYNNDVFISGDNGDVHAVTFGPLAISPAIQNSGLLIINGAAYNPNPQVCDCSAPPPPTWNCTTSGCIDPGDGSGQYTSLHACNDACTNYECVYTALPSPGMPGQSCVTRIGPLPGGSTPYLPLNYYNTLADCQANCTGPTISVPDVYSCVFDPGQVQQLPSYNCILNYIGPLPVVGTYSSLSDCQDNCGETPVLPTYDCTEFGCVINAAGSGQYATFADCQAACDTQPVVPGNEIEELPTPPLVSPPPTPTPTYTPPNTSSSGNSESGGGGY